MRAPSGAVDPNESSAMSKIGKPDFAGYMKKKGERYNTWKNRYFVLKGAHLYYMKSPQEDKVKGHIDLAGYKVLSDPNAGSGFGFQLVHDREKTHFFASNEHRVIKDWMKNLMKATISRDYSGKSRVGPYLICLRSVLIIPSSSYLRNLYSTRGLVL